MQDARQSRVGLSQAQQEDAAFATRTPMCARCAGYVGVRRSRAGKDGLDLLPVDSQSTARYHANQTRLDAATQRVAERALTTGDESIPLADRNVSLNAHHQGRRADDPEDFEDGWSTAPRNPDGTLVTPLTEAPGSSRFVRVDQPVRPVGSASHTNPRRPTIGEMPFQGRPRQIALSEIGEERTLVSGMKVGGVTSTGGVTAENNRRVQKALAEDPDFVDKDETGISDLLSGPTVELRGFGSLQAPRSGVSRTSAGAMPGSPAEEERERLAEGTDLTPHNDRGHFDRAGRALSAGYTEQAKELMRKASTSDFPVLDSQGRQIYGYKKIMWTHDDESKSLHPMEVLLQAHRDDDGNWLAPAHERTETFGGDGTSNTSFRELSDAEYARLNEDEQEDYDNALMTHQAGASKTLFAPMNEAVWHPAGVPVRNRLAELDEEGNVREGQGLYPMTNRHLMEYAHAYTADANRERRMRKENPAFDQYINRTASTPFAPIDVIPRLLQTRDETPEDGKSGFFDPQRHPVGMDLWVSPGEFERVRPKAEKAPAEPKPEKPKKLTKAEAAAAAAQQKDRDYLAHTVEMAKNLNVDHRKLLEFIMSQGTNSDAESVYAVVRGMTTQLAAGSRDDQIRTMDRLRNLISNEGDEVDIASAPGTVRAGLTDAGEADVIGEGATVRAAPRKTQMTPREQHAKLTQQVMEQAARNGQTLSQEDAARRAFAILQQQMKDMQARGQQFR